MKFEDRGLVIAGGGPAGSLLSILLARRGFAVTVVERGPEHPGSVRQRGRSINLALAARGVHALRRAGVFEPIEQLLIPMRGRAVHDVQGEPRFLSYGQREDEQIYSLSREKLNAALADIARRRFGVEYLFEHELVDVDPTARLAIARTPGGAAAIRFEILVGADGAGSIVRRTLAATAAIDSSESLLDHGYKELGLPAAPSGEYALEPHALHIWPRGGFMLIALPNLDRSFTATLFMPQRGDPGFERIQPQDVEAFFAAQFPDARALMPNLAGDYAENPVGLLGTISCRPWSCDGRVVLLGDAAHAIVPFHGQGMNAAFEDCSCFDELVAAHGADWPRVFADFQSQRLDNARAIAEMALENYREMRDNVRDERFALRSQLAFELERRFPYRFVPRYSMVMFHPEISYADAQRRGRVQQRILDELTDGTASLNDVDFAQAERLVERQL